MSGNPEYEHLLPKWPFDELSKEEEAMLPPKLLDRYSRYIAALIEEGLEDFRQGRVVDGPTAMARIRRDLEEKYGTRSGQPPSGPRRPS